MKKVLRAKTPVGTVLIAEQLYRNLLPYCQTGKKCETGGALAGYKLATNTWVISTLMHPSPKNKSGRTWLERDLVAAQEFVDRVHQQSEGQFTYIGEWHTHPEELPRPSSQDTGMLEDILKGSKPHLKFLFGIILGKTGKLCLWHQDRTGLIKVYHPTLPNRDNTLKKGHRRRRWFHLWRKQ
ncbi:MAG: Mov34/MPN/PAD-1 family protein [Methylacidiphilales bacterium]|nr:Mov34/MPN/PAD-1 family protein [Candidatus Methylacidiphilales bacterium]